MEHACGSGHPRVAQALIALASLREEQGRNAETLALLGRALIIMEGVFAADNVRLAELRKKIDASVSVRTGTAARPPMRS